MPPKVLNIQFEIVVTSIIMLKHSNGYRGHSLIH